ncbi:sensor domain-containing protein [Deinococcus hopiensis]|uniref:GAF domain-containing protein n=1 Tax=Deinococcus hopiensis KR-140 TaxID=695939 RepID=A0A1W1VGV8_9DEIO|nr:sensor domain-containing protein [Deinococcus hopiensis]SMB92592.1 GAF domain-containing protein [Deinococcus hopiensis KR-140]
MTQTLPAPRPRRPGLLSDLLRPRTYAEGLYLLLSFPLGLAYFCALAVGLALGASLVIVWVGLPLLLLVLVGALAAANFERLLAARLLGVRLHRFPRPRPTDGWWPWAVQRLGDVGTWKALLYLLVKFPFGLASFTLVVVLLSLSFGLLSVPFFEGADALVFGHRTLSLPGLAALPVAGVGVLVFTAGVVRGLAHIWSRLAGALLADAEDGQQARREVRALSRSASIIAFAGSLEETLGTLIAQAQEATGAAAFAVWHLEPGGEGGPTWKLGAARGLPRGFTAGLRDVYQHAPPLGDALRFGQAHTLPDARRVWLGDERYAPVHTFLPLLTWEGVTSLPLVYRGVPVGRLDVFTPERGPSRRELEFLGALADQAAVAVENARLFARVQEQASLEERQRLARELHDSVSQALYGVTLGLRTARSWLDRDPARAAEPMEYALSLAEGGTAEMKALLFALRPESLEQEGLVAALGKQADVLSARYRLKVHTDLGSEPSAALSVKEALFRIAQEALHNTVKHAEASEVWLSLRQSGPSLVLSVKDDGLGFDPRASFPGHLGLHSMRERAQGVSGQLRLETAPGAGVGLTVTVPAGELALTRASLQGEQK